METLWEGERVRERAIVAKREPKRGIREVGFEMRWRWFDVAILRDGERWNHVGTIFYIDNSWMDATRVCG